MAKRQLRGTELKDFRHKVAQLKNLGLVSKKVDARKQKSTRYMRDIVEKTFAPVLRGEAVPVLVPSRKVAREYKESFKVRGKKVVIPIEKGSKKPRYKTVKFKDESGKTIKRKEIVGQVEKYGRSFNQIHRPLKPGEKPEQLPHGKNIRYTMAFAHGMTLTRDTFEELEEMMYPYEFPREGSKRRPFSNWRNYVIIEQVEDAGSGEYDEDSDI